MDLRHDQLPWNDQIWAKINADLTHALSQSRRVRAPFEVFNLPDSDQIVLTDRFEDNGDLTYSETTATPVVQLSVDFSIQQSQVFNEGDNFFALDRIIDAAHELGHAEDWMLMEPNSERRKAYFRKHDICQVTKAREYWDGLFYGESGECGDYYRPRDIRLLPFELRGKFAGLELFNYVIKAREELRNVRRYEPYALILSNDLEGELSSTVPETNSLNTPIERLKPLVTAGIHTTPVLRERTAVVVSVSRPWVDIAQSMEPSVQFIRIGENGEYNMRLVERFAFRLKDRSARCVIQIKS